MVSVVKKIYASIFLILIVSLVITNCYHDKELGNHTMELEFSYDDTWSTAFSFKIATNNDTAYLRQYFISEKTVISDENKLRANQTYYAVLSQNEKANFKALLQNAQLNSMDSIYSGNVADGASYNLDFKKSGKIKSIFCYGVEPPEKLRKFGDNVLILMENLKFIPIDTTIYFRTSKGIDVNPKLDHIKFSPPNTD